MTTIDVAATLASAILIKGSVVGLLVMVAAKLARSASGAALALGLGSGGLALLVLLDPWLPQLGSGYVAISHKAIEQVSIGSVVLDPLQGLVALWAMGAVVMLARLVRDLCMARALAKRATHGEQRAAVLLRRAGAAVGCASMPELRETPELATAALIGFRQPVLLMPAQAREWSDEEFFGVLCHELEHARRNDWLMLMLERVVKAIFWINPLVHLVARQAAAAREMAADDAAIRAGTGATAYAGRLISVARELRDVPRMAVSVAFASAGVEARVKALFDPRIRRAPIRNSLPRAMLVALPLVVGLATIQPFVCLPSGAPVSESCP